MSRTIELPDNIYSALRDAADSEGVTPAAWIAAHLPDGPTDESAKGTLADRFAGRFGQVASGGQERLSESGGKDFAEHLEAKRQAGHL